MTAYFSVDLLGKILAMYGVNSVYRQVSFYAISSCSVFALMQLENLHHFLNVCSNIWFNMIWHGEYMIIFGLMRCGIQSPW